MRRAFCGSVSRRRCGGWSRFQFLFELMLDALKFAVQVIAWFVPAVLLLAALPFVFCSLYDGEDAPRQDEQFWLERGYPPLDASSTGEVARGDGGAEAPGCVAGE